MPFHVTVWTPPDVVVVLPRLRNTLVVAPEPLAPTTTSANPSPLTSPTATDVASGAVRVTAAAKVTEVAVAAVSRLTVVEPAPVMTTSSRPSRSRSARTTPTAAPAQVFAATALNAEGPVPRKSEVLAVVPMSRSSLPSPFTSPVAIEVTEVAVGTAPPAGDPP